MALPNLTQLQEIHTLLKEIESLEQQIKATADELESVRVQHEEDKKALKERYIDETKQFILLDLIEKELKELRIEESKLRESLEKSIDESIEEYLSSGSYKQYIADLAQKLEKKYPNQKLTLMASNDCSQYVAGAESVEGNGIIRIEIPPKTYILDPQTISAQLKNKLIQVKASQL